MADSNEETWAVVVFSDGGGWQVGQLPPGVSGNLVDVEQAVRGQLPGSFALVDVADDFFIVVRNQGGHLRFLLSDVTASSEWELAAQVMDRLDLDIPYEDDLDEVLPAGDLNLFDDLGLDAMELGAILSDVDAYADEMLSALARRLGFADAFERVVDALV
ncbi:MAG: tRNA adenosine deaminase-associated protein [Mycobacteriales bacterium]